MKLENERYEVTFTEKGGEIASFTDKQTGIQYMYQGNTDFWGGKNPTLFPMVGNTFSKTYEINGKSYAMKNHGLIRYMTLKQQEGEEGKIVMTADSDEQTLQQYPFDFHYEIHYTLSGSQLTIRYLITNTGEEVMPFSFGTVLSFPSAVIRCLPSGPQNGMRRLYVWNRGLDTVTSRPWKKISITVKERCFFHRKKASHAHIRLNCSKEVMNELTEKEAIRYRICYNGRRENRRSIPWK